MLALLVGYGSWGRRVAAKLDAVPGVRVSGVHDPLVRDPRVDVQNVAGFVNVMEPGLCVVATPPAEHVRVVSEVLGAGFRGVLRVEKPCGGSVEDAVEIQRLCNLRGVRLDVGYTLLDSEWFRRVEAWVYDRRARVLCVRAQRWSMGRARHDVSARVDLGSHVAAVAESLGAARLLLDARHGASSNQRVTWIETTLGTVRVAEVGMGAVIEWPDGRTETVLQDDALAASLQRLPGETLGDPVAVWRMLDAAEAWEADCAA